jgi:SAM-dependent methyltransferase
MIDAGVTALMRNKLTSSFASMVERMRDLVRPAAHEPPSLESFSRHQYKAVWNLMSRSEDEARFAICGSTSEDTLCSTASATLAMLQRCVGVREDDVFLEIGAGVGRVGAVLAPRCREWIGTDVSENMVAHLRGRLAGHANVRVVATNGFDLGGIASESIDVVYCTVVFMHLEEWERFSYIKEAFRVLKPGGRLLVDNVNLLSDLGWHFFEEHRAIPGDKRPPQISKTSTPQELEAYFQRAGFTEIRQECVDPWIFTFGWKPDTVREIA